ncbi:TetR/AcrR family transcriptional regulator [Actinokineospora iranica]|uniref:Regulatory protein, tetR family n=1 Tax=Actinokineospora iranica TaxID=1271860 RepID=A0A1G6ZG61_9PSEU|nr:helix-turn-helix domain-containing protein [Actinokineospora iranica]SDE01599.1 regulatory protein, tetR family [Actinokineospora iranica]
MLSAARELFATRGLSASLDDIARHAEVGAGTVHRNFPSKESLFATLVVDRVDELAARGRALATANDPGAALLSMLALLLDAGAENTTVQAGLAGTDFDLRAAAPRAAADLRAAVGVLLDGAQRAGAVRGDLDVDDVLALLAGAFAAARHAGGDPDRSARLRGVLFDALKAVPSQ